MVKRLAMTTDGKLTYCTSSDDNMGKGRCNHIAHQKNRQSPEAFLEYAENEKKFLEIKKLPIAKLKEMYKNDEVDPKLLCRIDKAGMLKFMLSKGYTEFHELVKSKNHSIKAMLAEKGLYLEKLKDDQSPEVRAEVAKHGVNCDKLINDEDERVRTGVALSGYGLETLINDEYGSVRAVVAERGYGLDKLVDDPAWFVRREVAKHGYGLEKLANDENDNVRAEVAKQGYKSLANDESYKVRLGSLARNRKTEQYLKDKYSIVRGQIAKR